MVMAGLARHLRQTLIAAKRMNITVHLSDSLGQDLDLGDQLLYPGGWYLKTPTVFTLRWSSKSNRLMLVNADDSIEWDATTAFVKTLKLVPDEGRRIKKAYAALHAGGSHT